MNIGPDRLTENIRRTIPDARIVETDLPLCPEIRLYLIHGDNFSFLEMFLSRSCDIFVTDSRVKSMDVRGYEKIDEMTATTIPDLNEADEFNHVSIYRAHGTTP